MRLFHILISTIALILGGMIAALTVLFFIATQYVLTSIALLFIVAFLIYFGGTIMAYEYKLSKTRRVALEEQVTLLKDTAQQISAQQQVVENKGSTK